MKIAQSCQILEDPLECVGCQAPLPMGFSFQEYWSGLPFPSAAVLPNPGTEPGPPALQALSIQATYNNNMTGTSAKLRSCWVVDAGHHPRSRWYYCPHFLPLRTLAHRGRISCQGSPGSSKSVPLFRSQVCQIVVCTLVCRMLSPPQ